MALAKTPTTYVVTVGTASKTLETLVSDAGGSIPNNAKGVRIKAHSNGVYMKPTTATTGSEPIYQTSYNYTGPPAAWKEMAFIVASGTISMTVELQELC